jgi:hypothetical protein
MLFLLPVIARAQQQESAAPPPIVDPRDAADREPSLVEPDFRASICRRLPGFCDTRAPSGFRTGLPKRSTAI